MVSLFFSYSHQDEQLRDQLERHLAMLKEQGLIEIWHDRRIVAGVDLDQIIDENLERSQIIVLLVSPDFLSSSYCYGVEVKKALELHHRGVCRVIPVILRPCDWLNSPLGKLRASPRDGKPVTTWTNTDEALLDVTRDIRAAVSVLVPASNRSRQTAAEPAVHVAPTLASNGPRSSNLRIRKEFSDVEKDRFGRDGFEYITRFFKNSLDELASRNTDIDAHFEQIDSRANSV
jgi:hypothetical protein